MRTTTQFMNASGMALGADIDPLGLVTQLLQGPPDVRLDAWMQAGPAGAPAIPALAPLLDADDPEVADAALCAMERIAYYAGRPGADAEAQAVAAALAAVLDPAHPKCREVLHRLSLVAGDGEVAAIAALLSNPYLAEDARLALLRCGTDAALAALAAAEPLPSPPTPLPQAHAHNDYVHPRPLLDALDNGFCGIEADIHLVDGALLVAHDADEVDAARTLKGLYLAPLLHRVRTFGSVSPNAPTCMLLIDIKSEAEPTYAALRGALGEFASMLTSFEGDAMQTRAVTVVVSGNRPIQTISAEASRLVAVDGRASDLDSAVSPALMPLLSDDWTSLFSWSGGSPMPDNERRKLREGVARVHAAGRKVRFWNTPHRTDVWDELLAAGVDYIGADDLGMLRDHLLSKREA